MKYMGLKWTVEPKDYTCKLGYVRYHLVNRSRTLCLIQSAHESILIAVDVSNLTVYPVKLTNVTGELKELGKRLFKVMMDKVVQLRFEDNNGY